MKKIITFIIIGLACLTSFSQTTLPLQYDSVKIYRSGRWVTIASKTDTTLFKTNQKAFVFNKPIFVNGVQLGSGSLDSSKIVTKYEFAYGLTTYINLFKSSSIGSYSFSAIPGSIGLDVVSNANKTGTNLTLGNELSATITRSSPGNITRYTLNLLMDSLGWYFQKNGVTNKVAKFDTSGNLDIKGQYKINGVPITTGGSTYTGDNTVLVNNTSHTIKADTTKARYSLVTYPQVLEAINDTTKALRLDSLLALKKNANDSITAKGFKTNFAFNRDTVKLHNEIAANTAEIAGKLSPNGNGSSLTGITASQVGAPNKSDTTTYLQTKYQSGRPKQVALTNYKIPFNHQNSEVLPYTLTANATISPDTSGAFSGTSTVYTILGSNGYSLSHAKLFSPVDTFNTNRTINTITGSQYIFLGGCFGSGIYRRYKFNLIDSSTIVGGPVQLNAPGSFQATSISQTEIDLSWTLPSPNGRNFQIYDSIVGVSSNFNNLLNSPIKTATSYNHTGLTSGQHVYYRIRTIGNGSDTLTSNYATANAMNATNNAPSFSSISFSGTTSERLTLTGSATGYNDPENDPAGTPNYKWQKSNDGSTGWTDISSATASTYTLQSSDIGKYIRFAAQATATSGTTPGNWQYSTASAQIESMGTLLNWDLFGGSASFSTDRVLLAATSDRAASNNIVTYGDTISYVIYSNGTAASAFFGLHTSHALVVYASMKHAIATNGATYYYQFNSGGATNTGVASQAGDIYRMRLVDAGTTMTIIYEYKRNGTWTTLYTGTGATKENLYPVCDQSNGGTGKFLYLPMFK